MTRVRTIENPGPLFTDHCMTFLHIACGVGEDNRDPFCHKSYDDLSIFERGHDQYVVKLTCTIPLNSVSASVDLPVS